MPGFPSFVPSEPGGLEHARLTASIAFNHAASPRTRSAPRIASIVDPYALALTEKRTTRAGRKERKKGSVHAGSSIRIG
jgi:hypothetical protein